MLQVLSWHFISKKCLKMAQTENKGSGFELDLLPPTQPPLGNRGLIAVKRSPLCVIEAARIWVDGSGEYVGDVCGSLCGFCFGK